MNLARRIASLGLLPYDFTPGVMPPGAAHMRAGTGWRTNSAGVIVPESSDVPRFDYRWNGSAWVLGGLLNEPSRTNLMIRSEEFDTWSNGVTYVTANQAVAPDGATTADKFKNGSNASPQLYRSPGALTSGVQYAWSHYLKKDPTSAQSLGLATLPQDLSGVIGQAHFNPDTNVFTVPGGLTGAADLVGAGYYRAWVSAAARATGTGYHQLNLVDTDNSTISAPDADSGFFIWGAQLEAASDGKPSSYIPTAAASVTRAADVLTLSAPNGTYSVEIERLSGVTRLAGQAVTAGVYTVPTDVSPLRRITLRRTG